MTELGKETAQLSALIAEIPDPGPAKLEEKTANAPSNLPAENTAILEQKDIQNKKIELIENDKCYYLGHNFVNTGPFTYEEVAEEIRNGKVTAEYSVEKIGGQWANIRLFPEFEKLLETGGR
jgi:hypothetical protein